jgi:radical SAM superfamily enzyme YgiQ (UPF0313 family)
MKVLLFGIDSETEPLGIMYITVALKNAGHQVDLELIGAKTSLSDITTSLSEITAAFKNAGHQVDLESIRAKIFSDIQIKKDYDFVGFSVLTGNHKHLLALCQRYREAGIKTIVGGPHATFFTNETLPFADFVVAGEGIKAVLDIVNGVVEPGIVRTDLTEADKFPMADREELYKDPKKYNNHIKNMLTGFGCPYSCNYCYNSLYNQMFPGFLRQRSVDNVIQEAKELIKYPLELIFFQEDSFGMNLKWLEEFAEKWPREINLLFHSQIRPESATEKRLQLLKKAGCHGISVGLETTNEKVRREVLSRGGTNQEIIEGCKRIKSHGFKLRTYQMIGLPESTIDDDLEMLRWNYMIQSDFARADTYLPLKGTVLGNFCIEKGLWDGNDASFRELGMDSESVLNYSPEHKKKLLLLQKIFHLAAKLPDGEKIAKEFINTDQSEFGVFLAMARKVWMDNLYETQ